MSKKTEKRKKEQLGVAQGTARNKLVKMILFKLVKDVNMNYCFQCSKEIEELSDLSIEHKIPWLDSENPKELYFDLNNIAFSHLSCNVGAARANTSRMLEARKQQGIRKRRKNTVCRSCKNEKDISEMVKDKRKHDGLDGECKKCKRERYKNTF